jgi:hypothetical protein
MSATITDDTVPVANPRAVPLVAGRTGDIPVLEFGSRTLHIVNPTAAALLLSCDGAATVHQIAAQLAVEFELEPAGIVDDVVRGLDSLRIAGLVGTSDEVEEGAVPGPPVIVRDDGRRSPDVVPCTCGTGIEDMPWRPTLSVAMGDVWVGLRVNDAAAEVAARDALAPVVGAAPAADPDAPPKLSLALVDDELSGVRPPARSGLFEDQQWLVMSPDHAWLLRWLTRRVEGWRSIGRTEVRLGALGVVGTQGMSLVPWTRGGDSYYVTNAAINDVEVAPAPVFVDTATSTASPGPGEEPVPLVGVVALGTETRRLDPDDALLPLLSMVDVRPGDDLEAVADGLDAFAHAVPVVEAAPSDAATVATALVRRR